VGTKVSQARKFLQHKDRVQVYVIFRGREVQHMAEGRRVLDTVLERLADVGQVERPPFLEGKRMVATLAPK
jgi:translation initiation factor IF-3